jgi:MSHA biogenesis protein MshK
VFKRTLYKSKEVMLIAYVLPVCLLGISSFSVYAQLDDPTRPPGFTLMIPGQKKEKAGTTFSLSLVQISSLRRTAIVNDKLVEPGDTVDGAKVLGIYPSSVKLKKKGKSFTIKLLSKSIKSTR